MDAAAKVEQQTSSIAKVAPVVSYSIDDPCYRMITHHLALFVG